MNTCKKISLIGALLIGVVMQFPIQAMADDKNNGNKNFNNQEF